MTLASVPGTPVDAPESDNAITNTRQIRVTYDTVTDNGGSPILSYELQMGSLRLRDFETISGIDPQTLQLFFTVTRNVEKGKTYTFRYRAINAVGAGGWSPIQNINAATIPMAPPRPVYVSSTNTSITVSFSFSTDNGGSKIIRHRLYRDIGNLGSAITNEEVIYDGASSVFTLSGLTAGFKYRIQFAAENSYGESARSRTLTLAASELPDIPDAPEIDWALSSKTSLFIRWNPVDDPASPIVGYIL